MQKAARFAFLQLICAVRQKIRLSIIEELFFAACRRPLPAITLLRDKPMTLDTEHILQHLLYSTFRRFSLDAFILNLGTFLIEYLPIMSIALRRFENKRITTLSYHSFNNLLAPPPKVIELSDELMQELYMHPSMSAYKYAARILSSQ